MNRLIFIATLCVAVSCLSACASGGMETSDRPAWIDNPGDGVSTSATYHVRGRAAQEELAILRAREEYAKRFGVSIESIQSLTTKVVNNGSSTVGSTNALETTQQTDIKARIKAKWLEPGSGILWVWLVPAEQ